jgi:hypothetical protein
MKQTAVEWLIEKVNGQSTGLGMYGMNVRIDIPADIIQQAKEIEKEQMIDVWDESRSEYMGDNYIGKEKSFEDYYNETFKANDK